MIVITTPAGNIGRQVLEDLLDSGEQLRLVTRDRSGIPADTRRRVEVIEGSHGDPAVADKAFDGADAVFWLTPPDPRAESLEAAFVGFTRPAAEAFRKHGVKRVVGVSALGRGTPWVARAGYVTASLAMDDLIAGTGVAYRALTNPSFMDNIASQGGAIKNQGMFFSPIDGDRKLPAVATRDIAAAASRLLLDDSWRGTGEVSLLGPEDLSFNDMARIMSEVLATPVPLPADHFRGLQGQVRRLRHVRGDGSGDDRHGLGEERRPGQRRPADNGKLDADQFPPVVRRGAQARRPRPGRSDLRDAQAWEPGPCPGLRASPGHVGAGDQPPDVSPVLGRTDRTDVRNPMSWLRAPPHLRGGRGPALPFRKTMSVLRYRGIAVRLG